ncbi:YihY/virulence factor BrkB family protein [Roseivirga echinicomitans]|nr:YihY/virulence factor BrkB family protein [Roseivirga echinicomitans]
MMGIKTWWKLLKKAFKGWNEDEAFRQSAIVAYYSIFSLPGLLILLISIGGAVYGQEAVQGRLVNEISGMIGYDAAQSVENMIASSYRSDSGFIMRAVGIGILLFGATTVFFQLQKSLNNIWRVEQKPNSGIKRLVFDRAYSLGLILAIGFLLLISLVVSAILAAISEWMSRQFPDYLLVLVNVLDFAITLGMATILFALVFKVLPDVSVNWRSVWSGAFFTAILFIIGKFALSFYFGQAEPASSYGAAGSIVLIMLWINYTCLIMFFGAEFTQAFAEHKDYRFKPAEHARWKAQYKKGEEKFGD